MTPLPRLPPLETLYEGEQGDAFPLPPALEALYGSLRFPLSQDRPYLVGNMVSTLDGVVTLNIPGLAGGGPISGFNPHDRAVMGLLLGLPRYRQQALWKAGEIEKNARNSRFQEKRKRALHRAKLRNHAAS